MTWEAWLTLGLLIVLLLALARQAASPAGILLGGALVMLTLNLFSDRFPSAAELAASFGNEGLLTIAALFVVAAGLTHTGALQNVGSLLLGRSSSMPRAQLRLMLPVGLVSAFLNNTPVVAMLIPVVRGWCRRTVLRPAKLLIPLSYASVLGGTCTLIGTSTNLVVQGQLLQHAAFDPLVRPFGMFTLAPVGLAVTAAGVGLIIFTSRWLLPNRHEPTDSADAFRQYTLEMTVEPGGPVDGKSVADAGLRSLPSLFLVEVQRGEQVLPAVGPGERLRGGDRLVFAGAVESVAELQSLRGLSPAVHVNGAPASDPQTPPHPADERLLVEAVVSHTSSIVGQSVRDARFRTTHQAAIVAVRRHGERMGGRIGDISLRPGDSLLLDTTRPALAQLRQSDDFYVVSGVADVSPPNDRKILAALLILAGLVVAMILTSVPWPGRLGETVDRVSILYLALAAGGAMIAAGCLTSLQARRSIDWGVLLVIGAALFIARGVESTGLAAVAGAGLMDLCRPLGPWGVLVGVYLLTLLLTETITNNAAAALAFPFAYAAAEAVGADVTPFAVAVAIAASCGFATPFAYQTHLMVLGPGRYSFGDFLRIGLPMDLITAATALTVIPFVFPLNVS